MQAGAVPSAGAARDAVEVTILWRGTVQAVLEKKLDDKSVFHFVIGEDPTCDYVVSGEDLGGRNRFTLATIARGVLQASVLPGMQLAVRAADGTVRYASADGGQAAACSQTVGESEIAEIVVGPLAFRIRLSNRLAKVAAPFSFDKRTGAFLGFSAFLHAAVLFALYLVPPDASGFNMDSFDNGGRFMKIMLTAPEAKLLPKPEPETPKKAARSGGRAHEGLSGQMGDRTAQRTTNRSGIKGPPDNLRPQMMRDAMKDNASTAGILAILSAAKMPTSPFGADRPLGFDPENALAALTGNDIGPNFGMGGLGPKGTGRGGGGDGRDTIGVGKIGRIAWSASHGSCTGAACPTWSGGSGRMRGRIGKGPILVPGKASVHGSLSKETIRRIVHRHINEIRFCYEQGLHKRPDLSGQVAVKFVITPSGSVQSSLVANSTVGDASVEMCISKVVSRMAFPMPENGGIVIVTYPFSLTSADS